jgi:AcrR family transcriptional regulator
MSIIDERRHRIAEVAANVIAREGLEAATVRHIAAEVGFSTTIVTHYFADKHELLRCAYQFVADHGFRRLDQLLARNPGDLVGSLVSLAPMDDEMRRGWGVYIAFWEMAKRDPAFAAEQRSWFEKGSELMRAIIRSHSGDRKDIAIVAQMLIALTYGISLQILFDRDGWSAQRVRTAFATAVDMALNLSPQQTIKK